MVGKLVPVIKRFSRLLFPGFEHLATVYDGQYSLHLLGLIVREKKK